MTYGIKGDIMKIKINNIEVLNLWNVLSQIYLGLGDNISLRWKLMSLCNEIFQIKLRFDLEKDKLIDKYGKTNDEGQKYLSQNDEHIKELLLCENNISPISLTDIQDFNFSLEIMMALKPMLANE